MPNYQSDIEHRGILIRYSNIQLSKDILKAIRPYGWNFFWGSLFRLSSDIAALYPSFALAYIVNFFSKYSTGVSLQPMWVVVALWGVASTWKYTARQMGKFLVYKVAEKSSIDAQIETTKHLLLLDVHWHEKENSGNKLKRIQKGGEGINRVIRMWIDNFIEIAVNFIGIVIILSTTDKIIGLATTAFIVIYFFISNSLLKKAADASQRTDKKEEEIMGIMFQAINNIRTVKVMAINGKLLKIIADEARELMKLVKVRIWRFRSMSAILDICELFFRLAIITAIAFGIVYGRYDVGFLILFVGYFDRITSSVSELSNVVQDLVINKYGIARMKSTLNEPVTIDSEEGKVDFPRNWRKITVRNLSFAYEKNNVLDNISFEIKRGERVGIVGLSGAGKSTILKLLLKENENFKGEILFDDVSLRHIKKSSYLKYAAVVLQDTEVFNFSLRENITIASDIKFSESEFKKALDIAHVSEFSKRLPKGNDTLIGEKGVKLSGGERQRLGIARAVYKQPQLLLLDEATSHLDLESEEKIKDSLHKFLQKVTAIVIAHRLTTIREMDRILLIENGKILESGNFDELYRAKGRFFDLWEKQKL